MMSVSAPVITAPDQVVIAGDWHGNHKWAVHVIKQAAATLPGNHSKLIIHLGDFGFWPGNDTFRNQVAKALREYGVSLWFIDGNHEWHDKLGELHTDEPGPVEVFSGVWHLPRGTRWEWHDIRWLAVGGAGSPDRKIRAKGSTWWPQEVITDEQVKNITADGEADVLVAHDCPWRYYPRLPAPPHWWDLRESHLSSQRLQRITDDTLVMRVFHGHLHMARDEYFRRVIENIHVTGLDMDGEDGNWQIINTRTLLPVTYDE